MGTWDFPVGVTAGFQLSTPDQSVEKKIEKRGVQGK